MSFRMSLAMRSVLMTHSAISRWILRNEEQASASLSNAAASFVHAILCTLQRAHIIILIAFILAKFISFTKCSLNTENKSLLLLWILEFRNMVLMWELTTLKLRNFKVFCKYNYLTINVLSVDF